MCAYECDTASHFDTEIRLEAHLHARRLGTEMLYFYIKKKSYPAEEWVERVKPLILNFYFWLWIELRYSLYFRMLIDTNPSSIAWLPWRQLDSSRTEWRFLVGAGEFLSLFSQRPFLFLSTVALRSPETYSSRYPTRAVKESPILRRVSFLCTPQENLRLEICPRKQCQPKYGEGNTPKTPESLLD